MTDTVPEGRDVVERETALWKALADGLNTLPDLDPYDDEEHLVKTAYDAVVKAVAPAGSEQESREASESPETPASVLADAPASLPSVRPPVETRREKAEAFEAVLRSFGLQDADVGGHTLQDVASALALTGPRAPTETQGEDAGGPYVPNDDVLAVEDAIHALRQIRDSGPGLVAHHADALEGLISLASRLRAAPYSEVVEALRLARWAADPDGLYGNDGTKLDEAFRYIERALSLMEGDRG